VCPRGNTDPLLAPNDVIPFTLHFTLFVQSKNYVCSLCGKASLLLSDPALDISPQDPLSLSQQAADAAAMAESIAQLSLKPAKTPHSPHVHANNALSGDLPGVGMAMKSSNFAADMDVGPFSVQEGELMFYIGVDVLLIYCGGVDDDDVCVAGCEPGHSLLCIRWSVFFTATKHHITLTTNDVS